MFDLSDAVIGLDLFEAYTWMYVLSAGCAVFALWFGYRIINSPYGLIFKALGENEERVSFVGLNVFRYKHMAFIISAGYAGAAGSLFVLHEAYIHPTTGLYWITSGDFVIMTVLGGTGSLIGPVFGALIFEYVSNVISGVSLPVIGSIGSLWRIVLGAVFVAVVWVFPQGVWGAIWGGLERVSNAVSGNGGNDE
jgi:branched-chain amino acid transport system permease protein